MSETIGAEAVATDPIALIQEQLGVDEAAAIGFASIKMRCTAQGRSDELSFGEFITSEHGAEHGATKMVEEIAAEARTENISPEEALANLYGKKAIVRDETGEIARVPELSFKKK